MKINSLIIEYLLFILHSGWKMTNKNEMETS